MITTVLGAMVFTALVYAVVAPFVVGIVAVVYAIRGKAF